MTGQNILSHNGKKGLLVRLLLTAAALLLSALPATAQEPQLQLVLPTDSITAIHPGAARAQRDSRARRASEAKPDSARVQTVTGSPLDDVDTSMQLSPGAITNVVKYQARDSVAMDLNNRRAFLYTDGKIDYDDMLLEADCVEVDFERQLLHAHGTTDTAGEVQGRPFFKQGESEYHADTITFNYYTQKGLIQGVITQEGDGFLHGNKVKKENDSVMYLSGGSYTTCNYAHPPFAIHFTKSKLITGDKIVTGPAWLTVEDAPTPIALPFALFPLNKTRQSGVLIPS